LSLLCKASPLIDELALYDVVNTPGVAADLSHISSIAKITGYLPKDDGLKHALTGADICIIPAGIPSKQCPWSQAQGTILTQHRKAWHDS
jgi:malate dehydrogenase